MPNTFCETPEGKVLIADGWGPVLAWDGFATQANKAGVPAPATKIVLSFSGAGKIVGKYRAFVRWLDAGGFPSNLSPIMDADVTAESLTGIVTNATDTTPIKLTLPAHGLNNSSRIQVSGIGNMTEANGTWDVTVIDANTVSLNDSITEDNLYLGGGTWISGAGTVTYSGLVQPQDPRVVRRQILRNTDGQQTTFYVDIDTTDLTSPTLSSTKIDNDLATGVAQPLFDDRGFDIANVHGEPPNNKPYIVYHNNKVFLAGDVNYTEGAVVVTFGSKTVTGIGTEWRAEAAARIIYVIGANKPYTIASCDPIAQTITLTEAYMGATQPYALYAIRSSQADQRTVWYSDSTHTEGFSAFNAFSIADDGDRFTGLLSFDSFMFVLEHQHIYKFTYQINPHKDGAVFLVGNRGCINQRCAVHGKGGVFMLDEKGVHLFGRTPTKEDSDGDLSAPIQTLFRPEVPGPKINFNAARFFHATLDQSIETIRWFVALSGSYLPRHALCYQYVLDRWWIEELAVPIGCSFVGRLYRRAPLEAWGTGRLQNFYGSIGRQVMAHAASPLDGVAPLAVYAAPITATGRNWFETPALMPAGQCSPVVVTGGRGEGQRRLITKIVGHRVYLRDPWLVRPDASSTVQIGGTQWSWKSGWLKWVQEEATNPRNVEVSFEPTTVPNNVILNRYTDRSDVPDECAIDRSEDGVTCRNGEGDILLSVPELPGGFSQSLMFSGKQRYTRGPQIVSLGLKGVTTTEPLNVYEIVLDGAVTPGTQTADQNNNT